MKIVPALLVFSVLSLSTLIAAHPGHSHGLETACSTMSCCEMTADQLSACANVSSNCPGYDGTGVLGKDGACGECPPGECRVVNSCVCPDDFLAGNGKGEYQSQCKTQYGEYWPTSIEQDNKECTEGSSAPPPSPFPSPATTVEEETVTEDGEQEADSQESNSTRSRYSVGNVVEYIREEAKHGTNVIGQAASALLIICLIAVGCCMFRRRR